MPLISVVIPCYNEADNIPTLLDRLKAVFAQLDSEYEIICVDDGSRDETLAVLRQLRQNLQHLTIVSFSKNFGHQLALRAGIDYAKGEALVMMDADLQHPPELISDMIALWKSGYPVVQTIRKDSELSLWKSFGTRMFYFFINALSPTHISANVADFRLIDRKVADVIRNLPEQNPFWRGIIPWLGFDTRTLEFECPPRFAGKTKYSMRRMFAFACNGIFSFSVVPVRMASMIGLISIFFCGVYIIYILMGKIFFHTNITGWSSLIISVLFLGSVQLISIGIIGEYIARIYNEVKRRPSYVVKDITCSQGERTNV